MRNPGLVSRTVLFLGAALCAATLLPGSAAAATPRRELIVYSVASGVQFINTADDRQRGVNNNPFNADTNKLAPNVSDKGNGPFPGDVAVYSFDLFANASLKKHSGTASYTCYFNYGKQALCQAYYQLLGGGGTVVASGPVDFDATGFKLVITGGTKGHLAARGQVAAVAAAKNSQRLDFTLLD